MRKKLKVSSGQRIDLVDYVHGANDYTSAMDKFSNERLILDRRSRVLDGFRVRIEDQTATPGLITVFNGNALDRDGQLVNNDESPTDTRSITLLGAGLTFYVEIEFTEVTSDTDSRFFWDPTTPATAPEVDGTEFSLNTATRITPDWRIVTPVSTTGFSQTASPGSIRIPVCKLTTNGSNQILVGGSNPGLVLVQPASVLEKDVPAGATTLRVVDARSFPIPPFTVTVGFGGAAPEVRTVSSVDTVHGLLSVPALTGAHPAGAIVRASASPADLVRENTDPNLPTGHPDPAQRLWQGDENRGSALSSSKETFGSRDDLNLRSLKDYVDFLAGQVREMKFGHPRVDVVSQAPPTSFSSRPRYMERAGSITGARSNTVSIGNGTTTFGDFNGTTEAVFTAAIAALPTTGGSIYVKGGTYSFASAVLVNKPVTFIGEATGTTVITGTSATAPAFSCSSSVNFENLTLSQTGGFGYAVDATAAVTLSFNRCSVLNGVRINGAVSVSVNAFCTLFQPSSPVAAISSTGGGTLVNSRLNSCAVVAIIGVSCSQSGNLFIATTFTTPALFFAAGATDQLNSVTVESCSITCTSSVFATTGTQIVNDVKFVNNTITVTNLAANGGVVLHESTHPTVVGIHLVDNYINITGGSTTDANPGSVFRAISTTLWISDIVISDNRIDCNTGSFVIGAWVDILGSRNFVFTRNNCLRLTEGVRLGSSNGYMANGTYCIEDNTFLNGNHSSHVNNYGVRFFNFPNPTAVSIRRNFFQSFGSGSTAGVRYGVDCTFNGVSGTEVKIEDNTFSDFSGPGTTNSAAVYFGSIATAAVGTVCIQDNNIIDLDGGPTGLAAGVYLRPVSGYSQIDFKVTGNRIVNIGAGNGLTSYGILVDDCASRAHITDNVIRGVFTSQATGIATGIQIATSFKVRVSRNDVSIVESANSSGSFTGANIRAVGLLSDLEISDNVCSQLGALNPIRTGYNIVVISDAANNVRVCGNVMTSSTGNGPAGGVFLSRETSSAAVFEDVHILNNQVDMQASTAFWVGIYCSIGGNSSGLRVHGNIVRERILGSDHIGIWVQGHNNPVFSRSVEVSNNVLIGRKTGALVTHRRGLWFADCQISSVVNNIIDWLEPGVAEGTGIDIDSFVNAVYKLIRVAGNVVRGDNNGSTFEIYINSTYANYGILDSNIVNTDTAAGVINPVTAPATWTYGTNA